MSLEQKVKHGTLWISASQALIKIFGLAAQVILARVLMPEDFGLVAIALIFLQALRQLGSLGFAAAVIHHQDDIDNYTNAAFWMSVVIFSGLMVITWIIAPWAAAFYQIPELKPILMALGIGFVFEALCSIPDIRLTKELRLKTISMIEISTGLVNKVVTIAMALTGFGVWSLILPELVAYPVKVFFFWKNCSFRPKWELDFAHCRSIFHFGKHIFGTNILRYLNTNVDYMIVGKILGAVALGYYTFAYNLANWIVTEFIFIIIVVAFPTFAKIQDDPERLKEVFLKIIKAQSLLSWPMFIGIILTANELLPVVYSAKWIPSIIPLQVLTIAALIRSMASIGAQALKALGRPDKEFKFNLILVVAIVIAIFIGVRYGILGTAIAVAVTTAIGNLIFLMIVFADLRITPSEVYQTIRASFWNSLLMVAGVLTTRFWLTGLGLKLYQILIVCIITGVVVFAAGLYIFFGREFNWIWGMFSRKLRKEKPAAGVAGVK